MIDFFEELNETELEIFFEEIGDYNVSVAIEDLEEQGVDISNDVEEVLLELEE